MIIIVLILLFLIIIYYLIFPSYFKIEEGLTADDSLATISSLYNKSNIKVKNLTANSLTFGNKWKLVATGDAFANDNWLRLMKADGTAGYGGGFAGSKLHASKDLHVTTNANISKTLGIAGDLTTANLRVNSNTINCGGRMHISPTGDDMYLIPKQGGIVIGQNKDGGNAGSGNLWIQGNLNVGGVLG